MTLGYFLSVRSPD